MSKKTLINPDVFLPSSRSIAFRKTAWIKAGGYPEAYSHNEDTPFDLKLKASGAKFYFEPNATVRWEVRDTFKSFIKQFYLYSFGDGEAKLFLKDYLYFYYLRYAISLFIILIALYCNKILLIIFSFAFILYIIRKLLSRKERITSVRQILLFPFILIAHDLANMIGYLAGRLYRK